MASAGQGRRRWDAGGVSGQRVPAERRHGLPSPPGDGTALRRPGGTAAMRAGGALRRVLRRGGLSAGTGVALRLAGEAPGGAIDGGHRLRRAAAFPSADAAALRPLLRHGGLRAGAGDALRRHAGGAGRLLYPGGPPGAAHRRHLGVSPAERRLPGGGRAGNGGQALAPAHPPGWPGDRPRRPLRQRQRPPGRRRAACVRSDGGGGPGAFSPGTAAASHGGGPPGPGGADGRAPAAGRAACAAALPDGGGRRAAAGPPLRLADGERRLAGGALGGPDAGGLGKRYRRPLGRGGRRRPWRPGGKNSGVFL